MTLRFNIFTNRLDIVSEGAIIQGGIQTIEGNLGNPAQADGTGNFLLLGDESAINNIAGIITVTDPNTNSGTVLLTNRKNGILTTIDNTQQELLDFSLVGDAGIYFAQLITLFRVPADGRAGIIRSKAILKTDGTTGQLITSENETEMIDAGLTIDVDLTVDTNVFKVLITGDISTTIEWNTLFEYRFLGGA